MSSGVIPARRYQRRVHIIPASTPKPGETSVRHDLPGPLKLSVHDYHVLNPREPGYSVILTHGTSFNKYFWELIVQYLLGRGSQVNVTRFIAIDAANHGDSAVLNRGVLPATGQ